MNLPKNLYERYAGDYIPFDLNDFLSKKDRFVRNLSLVFDDSSNLWKAIDKKGFVCATASNLVKLLEKL